MLMDFDADGFTGSAASPLHCAVGGHFASHDTHEEAVTTGHWG
jgi:hypothetical protein